MPKTILQKIFGSKNEREIKRLKPLVEEINRLEPDLLKLSDDRLKAKTGEFRERLAKGETLDDLLVEAFAVVREASRRTLGQRHRGGDCPPADPYRLHLADRADE